MIYTRYFLLFLCLLPRIGFAVELSPSELKGWPSLQSTILGGISQPSADLGQDFLLSAHGRSLKGRLWKQGRSRGLVLLLPGTGGNAESGLANLAAENFFRLGFDTLIVTNPFTPEFQESFSRDGLIGLPQRDVADVHRMLDAALKAYQAKFGQPQKLVLAGISLGAIYAGLEARGAGSQRYDQILLLNPPASLAAGIVQLDDMIRISIAESDVLPFSFQLIWAFLQAQHGMNAENIRGIKMFLPEAEKEGRRIIGDSFRQALRAVARGELKLGETVLSHSLGKRLEESLPSLTFERFIGYSATALSERGESTGNIRELLARANTASILTGAEGLGKVTVITNADDFLVSEADMTKLEALVGNRLFVFEAGGHCGNYWTPSFRSLLAKVLH